MRTWVISAQKEKKRNFPSKKKKQSQGFLGNVSDDAYWRRTSSRTGCHLAFSAIEFFFFFKGEMYFNIQSYKQLSVHGLWL